MFTILIRHLVYAVVAVSLTVLVVAGCGGGGDNDGSTTSTEKKAETTETVISRSEAKELFVTTCGVCHTLKAAGTDGSIGPNLDQLAPDTTRVETQIKQGTGAMPANLLQGEDAKAVARYVANVAGK